ncbi:MAG TPA: PAS domain-containing protein, partial [Candidatus Acidoferrales bacterium]|nr:PAS domain-containing protein [Candidatus Acidoferrales bacterium]
MPQVGSVGLATGSRRTTSVEPDVATQVRCDPQNVDESLLRSELNRNLLSLLRAALVVGLTTNILLGIVDILFEPVHDFRVAAVRSVLVGATAALWIATSAADAVQWAVPMSLIAVAVGCVQAVAPPVLHGDLNTPIVFVVALVMAVSTAAPWGIGGQLAAVAIANAALVGTIAMVAGTRVALDAYPTTAALVVFGASLYGASVCRRTSRLSIERGIALSRSAKVLAEREEALAQLNADLERRVGERTAQLKATNFRLEQESAERWQTSEALRRSQQQLRDILDNTTAVIYLKDLEGRYLLINSQHENLFDVSREGVLGRDDYDIFSREHADRFRRNDREVLAADGPLVFEEIAPHDDGEHTYVSVKFPLRDEKGVPYGVCGISTDITPRKQMEAQLRTSQAQLSAVIENTVDAIWSIDRTYAVRVVNSVAEQWFHEVYGTVFPKNDQIGRRAPAEETALWRPLYDRALGGEHLVFERQYSKGSNLHWYLISITPIVSEGQVTGATVFAKDIT